MTTTPDIREVSLADLVMLTSFMAEHGATASEVAYAVEKPWKHLDWLDRAKADDEGPHLTYCKCE